MPYTLLAQLADGQTVVRIFLQVDAHEVASALEQQATVLAEMHQLQ
jgi:hypothetical protein